MKTQTILKLKPSTTRHTWDNEPLRTVLFKMCKVVGANYFKTNFSSSNWFMDYSWTDEQEKKFQIWMANFLLESKLTRSHWKINKRTSKKELKEIVTQFTWNHGWKHYSGS